MNTDNAEEYVEDFNDEYVCDNLKFMVAAQEGCLAVISECLSAGQDVDSRDYMFDETALMRACRYGHIDTIKYLLENGADINATTSEGSSALHVAVLLQHPHCLEFLLSCKSIKKDVQDSRGNTPLMVAAERGFARFVQLLLTRGCNPNIANAVGRTAIHFSLMPYQGIIGNRDGCTCLRILVEHGANINAVDQNGMTPVHCAVQRGNKWALYFLVCENCNLQKVYHAWTVDTRQEFGVDLPATPLVMAVYYLNEYMVTLLYHCGCDMLLSAQMLPYASKSPPLYNILLAAGTSPRNLKDACKFVIRAVLGIGVQTKVNSLQIPDCLRSILRLTDLQVPGNKIHE
ncbi:death-associated protein kinase 1-like [Gigantopelta aegis]|uniref:death-associated protein kinase 1-like n=1 Tax=Gigantopelta aegis TaxID=1735272 RepID=UPI001B88AA09|nr:death-associated protein kinase 1-like [Gigantopelta aegis]